LLKYQRLLLTLEIIRSLESTVRYGSVAIEDNCDLRSGATKWERCSHISTVPVSHSVFGYIYNKNFFILSSHNIQVFPCYTRQWNILWHGPTEDNNAFTFPIIGISHINNVNNCYIIYTINLISFQISPLNVSKQTCLMSLNCKYWFSNILQDTTSVMY